MPRQIVSKEEAVEMKRERVPLHEARDKVKTRGLDRENFHYIFIHLEDPDNVNRYLDAGYEFVQADGTTIGDQVVDTSRPDAYASVITIGGGKGSVLGLVCLPMDLYLQDQAAEERDIKAREMGTIKDINSTADPRKGNIGTGLTSFGSHVTASPDGVPS